ncbi:hypothetical protein [Ureibacillus chungkukjangi]|uniref:Uncharacterized protein n=1 Tax=Ureibacillus chungkukjangi TaxID=1202712 RepID=A0A318TS85_9BACL|nr:hypothetical protein [Ureibacillus chungkukjangi]MCM3388799.1 hypothetical protein [Ureibacillus chungkukjangi]PYF06710.1 hypothetical protein BJ095_108133 [Ureibacillus chungkukjangi]
MSIQAIRYYEEKFKEYIMSSLVVEQFSSVNQLLEDLINENPEDHKIIHYAYINVKKELTGFIEDSGNGEDLCEQSKHI